MARNENLPPLGDELMMTWAEDMRQALETIAHGEVPDDEFVRPEVWMRRVAREVLNELDSAAREQAAAWKLDEVARQQAVARKPRSMSGDLTSEDKP